MSRAGKLLLLAILYVVVAHLIPHPVSVTAQGWRLLAIFLTVIVGMMLQPLPGAALVLIGLSAAVLNGTPMREALGGYAEPSVWLVLLALLMARVLMDTGMARRIALLFIRTFGHSSMGVGYALVMTDITLATGVPSITARSAGMVMPVAKGIAELFGSSPGPSSRRLGSYLFATVYQGSAVACAMFLTGQASNVLAANLSIKLVNVEVSWSSWLVAACIPGIASVLVVPWLVHRVLPPDIKHTPEAAAFARSELARMGPLSRDEWIAMGVFTGVGLLWLTSGVHGLDVTLVAFLGLSTLLLTGTLRWEQAATEKTAWDVLVWYGGLLRLGELINNTGVTRVFAESIGGALTGIPWFAVLLVTLLIYFYTHYFFASITSHMLSMFPPFVLMLTSIGTPPLLAVYSLMCLTNLPAGLTHYGTTTGPILFSQGYVTFADWWRTGFIISVANVAIWLTIGFGWWKTLGFY